MNRRLTVAAIVAVASLSVVGASAAAQSTFDLPRPDAFSVLAVPVIKTAPAAEVDSVTY